MAAPLSTQDMQNILSCLAGALDQNPEVQKQSEAFLSAVETRLGFCSTLAEIIGNPGLEHSARYLASVHFKNFILKHWKAKTGQAGVTAEERAHIKEKLLQLTQQGDNQIAVQIALVYGKIARFDFPLEWPNLLTDLMGLLQAGQTPPPALAARRVYLILHHVLKELSSKRLPADKRTFAEVTRFMFGHVWERWCADTQLLIEGLPSGLESPQAAGQPALLCFERWLLLLKIVRRLILFGFESDAKSLQPVEAVNACMPPMVHTLQRMVALMFGGSSNMDPCSVSGIDLSSCKRPARSHLAAMLQRGVLKLLKTQCQVQEVHPWSYHAAGMLVPLLGFCCDLVGSLPKLQEGNPSNVAADDLCLIQCMVFTTGVLNCNPYKGKGPSGCSLGDSNEDVPAKQLAQEVGQALHTFWSPERLTTLCVNLVGGLLVLRVRDLEDWRSNPEEYYHHCCTAGGMERVSLVAENLYLVLLKAHREVLCPVVMGLLQQASRACPEGVEFSTLPGARVVGVPKELLVKEAVYNAVAIGAYELHDYLDWSVWLRSTLLKEIAINSPVHKAIRLRIARLISGWVARVENDDRPAIYRSLAALLSDSGDICLQLAAVEAFHTLVDDWNFSDTQFAEFVGPLVQSLMGMLTSSAELDTQTQVFNLMNVIIERLGESILPYAEAIIRMLPQLWTDADGQPLVRIQVLLALQRLVNVLGPNSVGCYPLLIPLITSSVDPARPDSLSLAEDGLCLWLVAARNAPHASISGSSGGGGGAESSSGGAAEGAGGPLAGLGPLSPAVQQLLAPFPMLASLMASSTEHIRVGLQLMSSLTLLGGDMFVRSFSKEIQELMTSYIGNVNERGMLLVFNAMDMFMTVAPQLSAHVLQPALLKLLNLLIGGQESPLVVATANIVFARLLLQTPALFMDLFVQAVAHGLQPPPAAGVPLTTSAPELLLLHFLAAWMENFDGVAQPRQRKLAALAQCYLLSLPSTVVFLHFDAIVANITGVWHEQDNRGTLDAKDGGGDGGWGDDDGDDAVLGADLASEDAAAESERRQLLRQGDPVRRLHIRALLQERLGQAAAVHGAMFQTAIQSLDASIAAQLKLVLGVQ